MSWLPMAFGIVGIRRRVGGLTPRKHRGMVHGLGLALLLALSPGGHAVAGLGQWTTGAGPQRLYALGGAYRGR